MLWGIIGALDAEVALLRGKMQVEREESLLGTTFYAGTLEEEQVVLVCCGVGKVNAAVCATTLIQKYGVERVVNVGIAGAAGAGLHVLDVVIGSELGFHDQDAVMLKYHPKRAFFPTDDALRALCETACAQLSLPGRAVVGRIVSGDQYITDSAVKADIIARCAPACVEMEGAAIGHACYLHGTPFLVIRTLSDNADEDADVTYDNFLERAADQSAHIILRMLSLA